MSQKLASARRESERESESESERERERERLRDSRDTIVKPDSNHPRTFP